MEEWDLVVIGGGAAGYFGAIACAEAHPGARVLILEATARVLTKVKISGGGRCNVTHHQFDPKQLTTFYPRGQKELLGPFFRFQPTDTVAWFAAHGVQLKVEDDGRMFPTTNNSQTIVDCLELAAQNAGVVLQKNTLVQKIVRSHNGYEIHARAHEPLKTRHVLLASGSMPYGVGLVQSLGHTLVPPVPSLFTFEVQNNLIQDLAGVSFPAVQITLKIEGVLPHFVQQGPCLITHWGLSGPAVLKLSAFAARELHKCNYKAKININWVFPLTTQDTLQKLEQCKQNSPKKKIANENPFPCVRRFWDSLLKAAEIPEHLLFGESSKKQLLEIATLMTQSPLLINGKGVFKEEFVTAGGISREEIDFRTMESKLSEGLYFAGEVVDVDGVTGGFNFQNAWTGSYLAGQDVARNLARKKLVV